jgi:lactate dehydrogenase-like 2-hydroxyacid dehydrogenase
MSDRPRVLLTRRWPQAVEDRLAAKYDLTINAEDVPMSASQLATALCENEAVCPTVSDRITAAVITTPARRARLLGNFGAGFEHIDLDAARAAGIQVSNTPDVLTDATADIALTLILMASRRAAEGERELREGRWTGWRPTHLLGRSLTGKTLGLVGYGRIARATADRARAFGMRIAYHSRRRAEDEGDAVYHASLEDLAETADVLSLHTPGGSETRHMVDARLLGRMKPGSILINTARGSVVDEAALAHALCTGVIAAAGLDVYEREPVIEPALLSLENVVLLPHLGSATLETRTAMGMKVADNLDAFFAGEALVDRVA